MIKLPGRHGYAMPAEWHPHRATWIAWPHNTSDWKGKFGPIPWVYGEIVRVLSNHERVCILANGRQLQEKAERVLTKVGVDLTTVDFFRIATDRVWTRDSGPIFVVSPNDERMGTCWRFNGWAKYPDHLRDRTVARQIVKAARVPECVVSLDGREVVMEGGAIDVDGQGLLMATEECLLSDIQARNPGLERRKLETLFSDILGVRRVIWLGRGIVGDDTHGHVDDLARFIAPGRVVLCQEEDPRDENYALLCENRERLREAKLEVISLPMPAPVVFDGRRVPASYANFYIANNTVIVPTFNDPQDRVALGILADCFKGRQVIGIHCVDLVWGLGTLHCATQQEPGTLGSVAE